MRDINFLIVLLVVVLYLIILMIETSLKIRLNLLFLILLYIIMVRNLVVFFLLYEIVFVLIIFTIILLGYSFERLIAAFLMIFYSFLFSRPALMIILLFDSRFLMKHWLYYSLVISYFLVGSFIVKFPIFGFHYWLPVAHVEASTVGSIILAGLLLKLGSIGLMYTIMYLNFIVKLH
jgi:NADH:ubiquinone oxidoreductase subunit 4 (subunit M)